MEFDLSPIPLHSNRITSANQPPQSIQLQPKEPEKVNIKPPPQKMTLMKRQSKVKAKSCQKVMNLDEYMPKDSIPRKKWLLGMGMKDKALIVNGRQSTDNKSKVVE